MDSDVKKYEQIYSVFEKMKIQVCLEKKDEFLCEWCNWISKRLLGNISIPEHYSCKTDSLWNRTEMLFYLPTW